MEKFQSDLAKSGLRLSISTLHSYKHFFLGAHSPEWIKEFKYPRKYLQRIGEICDELSIFKLAFGQMLRKKPLISVDGDIEMEKLDKIKELAAPAFAALKWNPRTWDLFERGVLEINEKPPCLLVHLLSETIADKEWAKIDESFSQMVELVRDIEANTGEYLPFLCLASVFESEQDFRDTLGVCSLVFIAEEGDAFPPGASAQDTDRASSVRAYKLRKQQEKQIADTLSQTTPETLEKLPVILGQCEKKLADQSLFVPGMIDAVITDPPYGDEEYAEWRPHLKRDIDSPQTSQEAAELVAKVAAVILERKLVKPDFVWLQFMPLEAVHIFVPPLQREFDKRGLEYKYQLWVWDKKMTPKVGGTRSTSPRLEGIAYFNFGRALAMKQDDKDVWMHNPLFVCRPNEKGNFWKPVPLLEQLIKLVTYDVARGKHQVILDPFAGRGSTGVGAIKCNREFRLIESNKDEFQMCQANILKAQEKCQAKSRPKDSLQRRK